MGFFGRQGAGVSVSSSCRYSMYLLYVCLSMEYGMLLHLSLSLHAGSLKLYLQKYKC